MKKYLFLLLLVISFPQRVSAQEEVTPRFAVVAEAGEDRNVAVGRTILFDASGSVVPSNTSVNYAWDFGDGKTARGIDATHTYNDSGTYRVILTVDAKTEDGQTTTSTDEIIVSVQKRLLVLIVDQSIIEKDIATLQQFGLTQGTLVIPIRALGVDQEYLTVQNLAQQILENEKNITSTDIIVTWTSGNIGLNSFIELARIAGLNNTSLAQLQLQAKTIVAVTDQSLSSSAKIAQAVFQSMHPASIVVADKNILDDVIQSADANTFTTQLANSDAQYQLITEYTSRGLQRLGPFNFMSFALNFMINHGVPITAVFLTLMLPVMATIVAFARQIVGIKSFGIFVPTILALTFLSTGLKYGLSLFIIVILVGTLARISAHKLRIMYMPRMAIVLSLLAMSIFALLFAGAFFNVRGLLSISMFPILVMTVLTEHFIAAQIEQGYKSAVRLTLETLLLSIIGFSIGDWAAFKTTILAYPELVLVTLLVNIVLGKFSGLRLTEYFRFRKVLKKIHADTTTTT